MTNSGGCLAAGRARQFRFAVGGPTQTKGRADLVDHVVQAEALGFDIVTFPDHLFLGFDPLMAMAAAAMVTERIRIGALMVNSAMRNAVVLAKELACADVLSDGRLEAGIGAGWNKIDFEASGMDFPSPRTRIEAMEEVVTVLRSIWAGSGFSFRGKHVQVENVPTVPAPVQAGGPPILMGGGGRRVLESAGRLADQVTISGQVMAAAGSAWTGREALAERVAWVSTAADSAGRAPELHILLSYVTVTSAPDEVASEIVTAWEARGVPAPDPDEVLASPFVAIGTVAQIADKLRALRDEFGISFFSVRAGMERELAPVIDAARAN